MLSIVASRYRYCLSASGSRSTLNQGATSVPINTSRGAAEHSSTSLRLTGPYITSRPTRISQAANSKPQLSTPGGVTFLPVPTRNQLSVSELQLASLKSDPYIVPGTLTPKHLQCRGCQAVILLKGVSDHVPGRWYEHRRRCAGVEALELESKSLPTGWNEQVLELDLSGTQFASGGHEVGVLDVSMPEPFYSGSTSRQNPVASRQQLRRKTRHNPVASIPLPGGINFEPIPPKKRFSIRELHLASLTSDPCIFAGTIKTREVQCRGCGETIKLKGGGDFHPKSWYEHRKACLELEASGLKLQSAPEGWKEGLMGFDDSSSHDKLNEGTTEGMALEESRDDVIPESKNGSNSDHASSSTREERTGDIIMDEERPIQSGAASVLYHDTHSPGRERRDGSQVFDDSPRPNQGMDISKKYRFSTVQERLTGFSAASPCPPLPRNWGHNTSCSLSRP